MNINHVLDKLHGLQTQQPNEKSVSGTSSDFSGLSLLEFVIHS